MKHKKLERIDYVAPQVIDLGFPDSLYGQVTCAPYGSGAGGEGGQGCVLGAYADGSCHRPGNYARTRCENPGQSAGVLCLTGPDAK